MEMRGELRVPRPGAESGRLNDPDAEELHTWLRERRFDTEFTANVARVGPVKASFRKGDADRPRPAPSYTITGEGTGGVPASKGSAKVALDDVAPRPALRRAGQVGGKLAQIGSRLIDATSRKMADDFFNRFLSVMTPPAAGAVAS